MSLFNFFLPRLIELTIVLIIILVARYYIDKLGNKSSLHRLEVGLAVAFIGLAALLLNADLSVPLTGALNNFMEIAKTTEVDNNEKILEIMKQQMLQITKVTYALRTLISSMLMWCVALAYITRYAVRD